MSLNKTYAALVRSYIGSESLSSVNSSSMVKLLEKAISDNFNKVDELNQQILDMKVKHTQDMFELKLKLSNLIELNYKLVTKETDG